MHFLFRSWKEFQISVLALVALLMCAHNVFAHEMRPAVADVAFAADKVSVRMEVNLEAIIAGIDLRTYEDTNDAPAEQAAEYDRLRALDASAVNAAFDAIWPSFQNQLTLQSVQDQNDTALVPSLVSVEIAEEPDAELPRTAELTISADLPAGAQAVRFGWARPLGPVIVRQMGVPETQAYTGYLIDGVISEPISITEGSAASASQTFFDFIIIGFEHIIPKGLDHILFVLGLFFLSMKFKPLLLQVTAFTLAHTVTLAMATLGWVSVPASIVEPLIAASIVYVAVENIFSKGYNPWRLWIVFAFGLLHGLGFASVLGDVGLNPALLVPSLIGFNVGVELGQLAVIAMAFLAVGLWFGKKDWYKPAIATPASVAIAAVGAWWFYERVFL